MAIGGDAENDLQEDEKAEPRHGKEQGVPLDSEFAVEELLAEPETYEDRGAGFENEN